MNDDDYDELFRATYPRLVAMGLAMSTERHVAQELAQETMLRAYRRRDELATYDSPTAWCRRVMGNLLIDRHRSRTSERAALERIGDQIGTDAPIRARADDPAEITITHRWNDLVSSLSPQQRLVATLFYAEDQSVATIAETMEIATGTVKSALSKARRNLRRTIGASHHEIRLTDDDEGARS